MTLIAEWALMEQEFYIDAVLYAAVASGLYQALQDGARYEDLDRLQGHLTISWQSLFSILNNLGYVRKLADKWYWVGTSGHARRIHRMDTMRRWLNLASHDSHPAITSCIQSSENDRLRESSWPINMYVLKYVPISNPMRWMDVGGGSGTLAETLANSGVEVTMADTPDTIARVAKHLKHPHITLWAGDIVQSLPNGTFDVISLIRLIENFSVETTLTLLKRLRHASHKSTRMVLVTTDADLDLWAQLFSIEVQMTTHHGRLYSLRLLKILATKACWRIKQVHQVDSFRITILEPVPVPNLSRRRRAISARSKILSTKVPQLL
ncbi:methyltransferase [Sulfobacillus thermosulfidooxidans]|uniref:methyltransferase n=1 Tax=Sulfobacillus thermosulfidooxidans TaxID=28034 RepID=UPI0014950584|nr:methyltransferase domain-containing protein [Sulfobacillus thermosulfidooxidans]